MRMRGPGRLILEDCMDNGMQQPCSRPNQRRGVSKSMSRSSPRSLLCVPVPPFLSLLSVLIVLYLSFSFNIKNQKRSIAESFEITFIIDQSGVNFAKSTMARRLTVPRGGTGLAQLLCQQQRRQPQRFW